jgi:hypothetical protein
MVKFVMGCVALDLVHRSLRENLGDIEEFRLCIDRYLENGGLKDDNR